MQGSINTSVLVAAQTKTKIPVSCVEAGRWGYRSRFFGSSGSHSPPKLRYVLKASVSRSVKAKQGHRSDQGEVWEEVARQQSALGASSGTSAMSDTFLAHRKRLDEYQEKLQYVEGAIGAAVAVGGRVVFCDLSWEPADPVGEGEELRASSEKGDHASVLVFDDVLVHGSVVCEA